MDFNLAAMKLLCDQLKNAEVSPSRNATSLYGVLFQRAWLQGILVATSGDGNLLLDEGTGVIQLSLSGTYVMVVGLYALRVGESPMIKVHKIVDLTAGASPNRELMWYLEVMERTKCFTSSLCKQRKWEYGFVLLRLSLLVMFIFVKFSGQRSAEG